MALTKPPVLPAWAETGDKVQPTNAEIQAGWPLSNVPPARQRWNWILNFVANGIRYLTRRGLPDWAADEPYEIGDCARGPDGLTYRALTQNTNKTPAANAADWERWGFSLSELFAKTDSRLSKSVAGNADVTLTAAEALNGIINFTGALTGNINVIVPTAARRWLFTNNTTGNYTLTVKTAAGTGYALPQGVPATLYCDGTNVDLQNELGATPAQFDTSKRLATMEALQRALGNMQGGVDLNTATALTAADVGKAYLCYGGTGFAITLPASSACPPGAVIEIASYLTVGNAVTVNRAGADTIYGNATGVTSLTINPGESVRLVNSATGNRWVITGGDAQLPFASMFGASLAASGYQKLPSGLIIQWGAVISGGGGDTTWTFPIAFPTACCRVMATAVGGGGTSNAQIASIGSWSASSANASLWNTSGARVSDIVNLIAIGR